MPITLVKKRNGQIVPFDETRIERAIEKAFSATGTAVPSETISQIAEIVRAEVEAYVAEDEAPHVEFIQDLVEKNIAETGYFEVAKAYILYRSEHQKQREAEAAQLREAVEKRAIKVKRRNGTLENFDPAHIEEVISKICGNELSKAEVKAVIDATKASIYDGISSSDINLAVIMVLRGKIERDPAYSFLTARFLINELYKQVLGVYEIDKGFAKKHQEGFATAIKRGVEIGRYDTRLLDFDLAKLAAAMEPERDHLFQYLGAQTLFDRYFMKDADLAYLETPQYFWMRVAMGLSITETDKEASAIGIYTAMSQLRYVSSTPTLLHAGTTHPQMSSCYLNTVEDDLHHIFKVIGDNAQLSKWSGGIGTDWTNIRATNARIKSINIGSQGVVPFLKIVDSTTASINRSGKRRGAACVYLETWHYDVEEFLELRKNTGDDRRRTHDINTANWIPDLFMKRVIADQEWTLFSPEEVPDLHDLYGKKFEEAYAKYEKQADEGKIRLFKRLPAVQLWRKMVTMIFETGHPWVTFKDPSNIRSPQDHVGVVHSSNLCTEITLNTSAEETAVCNLGSINLSRHITPEGTLDKKRLEESVHMAMRALDNVIDLNFYPTKEAETSNMRHRPVGLGIMGLQDAFYLLGIAFDSDEAVEWSDEIMEFISYQAILASSKLAKEKGTYSSYKGSKWDRNLLPLDTLGMLEKERGRETGVPRTETLDWKPVREHIKKYGMRNSNCMAIAPTATIANIAGCLPSIEPIYKNLYTKSNFSGEFTVVNRYLVDDLKKLDLWNDETLQKIKYYDGSIAHIYEIPLALREKYKETFEIEARWIVKHAAHRGKWIDQSQSINLFINSESGKLISDTYILAWQMGLKTTYYLRTLGASAVEKSTLDINKQYAPARAAAPGGE